MRVIAFGVLAINLFVGCGAAKKTAATQSQTVGPSGGTLTSGAVKLTVPAGALATSQNITVTTSTAALPAGYSGLSPLYDFGPAGLIFQQPVTVSLGFSGSATHPTIYWSNSSGGYDAMATTVSATVAQTQVTHLGSGFVAETQPVTPSSAKAITAFSFATPPATGTIDEDAKTIAVEVPSGTDVTALVATFTTTGASVAVGSTAQVSGTTSNNFTSPIVYTATAADASTASYTVTVTVATAAGNGPDAPTVTYPASNARIVSPVAVQGTGEPNATINLAIMNGANSLGTFSGTADANGVFNLLLPSYTAQTSNTALNVVVTQTVDAQTSAATTVAVFQGVPGTMTIELMPQTMGETNGEYVYLQVFATATPTLPLQSSQKQFTSGQDASQADSSFTLPVLENSGAYYFFAFRDADSTGVFDAVNDASSNSGVPNSVVVNQQNAPLNESIAGP